MKFMQNILIVILLTLSTHAYADSLLALDTRNTPVLPLHFRTSTDALPATINSSGLAELHAAGGAQFAKLSLAKILHRLKTKHLTIIDLRQESHGFLDGNAISWYGTRNATNEGMTDKNIEKTQFKLLHALAKQEYASAYLILKKSPEGNVTQTKPVEFSVHTVSSEEDLTTDVSLSYEHFYVQDYHAPSAKQVDRFLQMVKQLPKNQWVYFHCRAGLGRTTTFMVMYDILHNAKNVSLEDILTRQVALGGKDLTKLPKPGSFKYSAAVERLAFVKEFYRYAKENKDDFETSWSSWEKQAE